MLLTKEQIVACAAGYLQCEEKEDGLQFYRMTDAHRAAYEPGRKFYYATYFTAGVVLDFYTDSPTVTVKMSGKRRQSLDRGVMLDILADGALVAHIRRATEAEQGVELIPFEPVTLTANLRPGEHRVTVYLPYLAEGHVQQVELADGSSFRPAKQKKKWVVFGDSITNGSQSEYPSMTYISQTARQLDAETFNFAIGGESFNEEKLIPGSYPDCDFVTIAYGTNDFNRHTAESFAQHMGGFFRKAAEEFGAVPIFVQLPIWRQAEEDGEAYGIGTLQSVRDAIAAEAAKYPNMVVIDAKDFVPHLHEFFMDEVLHPNALGMSQYARHLTEAMQKHI